MKRTSVVGFVLVGLAVTAVLAAVVSGFASSSPDGLERVAGDQGFLEEAEDHDLGESPVADYAVRGVDNDRLSTGLAGLVGITVTFAVGYGLFFLLRRRSSEARTSG
ncbi:MAG: PDGLE domain-containing protein [Acidimicrobiales bacterium]